MEKNSGKLIAFIAAFIFTACGGENSNTTTDGSALKQRDPTVGSVTGPVLAPSSSTSSTGSITLATQTHERRYGYSASGIVSASTNWHVEYYNSNPGFTWYSQATR